VPTWTSRAWYDQHQDYPTRNLLYVPGTAEGDGAEARAYNQFTPNNERPTWPTLDEVMRWDKQNLYPGVTGSMPTSDPEMVQFCLDAAIERASGRCHLHVQPVDGAGAGARGGAPVRIPAGVKLWTVMETVRLARRRQTPDGMAGSAELGNLMRVSGYDAHAEAQIEQHLVLGLA
jgi:hypothetical protein